MSDIYNNIYTLIKERLDIDIDREEYKIDEESIFGIKIGMCARDLVYLIVILEKEYNITIDEKYIDDDSFYTIKGIAEAVCQSTASMKKAS